MRLGEWVKATEGLTFQVKEPGNYPVIIICLYCDLKSSLLNSETFLVIFIYYGASEALQKLLQFILSYRTTQCLGRFLRQGKILQVDEAWGYMQRIACHMPSI